MAIEIKPYAGAAGGFDALASSFRHVREQGIVGRGVRTMLHANNAGGFDCPGCAWPDRNPQSSFSAVRPKRPLTLPVSELPLVATRPSSALGCHWPWAEAAAKASSGTSRRSMRWFQAGRGRH